MYRSRNHHTPSHDTNLEVDNKLCLCAHEWILNEKCSVSAIKFFRIASMLYLPLLDHGAHLVTGEVHAMEVGEAVLALYVFCD